MSGENNDSVELYQLENGYQARPTQVFTPPQPRNVRMAGEGFPQDGSALQSLDFAPGEHSDEESGQSGERRPLLGDVPLLVSGKTGNDSEPVFESVNASRCSNASQVYRSVVHFIAKDLHQHAIFNRANRDVVILGEDDEVLHSPERLKHFVQGSVFVSNKLWAPAFWGMFLHDLIVFGKQPLDRYGTTFGQLWIGTATNYITVTSNFRNDLPGTWAYSVVPALVTAAIPVGGMIWMFELPRTSISNIFSATLGRVGNIIPEGLKGLGAKNIYKNYIAWKNDQEAPSEEVPGEEAPTLAVKIARDVVFLPFVSAVFYANVRLLLLDLFKILGWNSYREAKDACFAQNKTYVYLKDYGNYECVVVDWDFIDDALKFTNQEALRGLLHYSQDPDFINQKLKALFRSRPYFKSLDLSGQHWKQWMPSQWKAFLTTASNHLNQLDRFILGTAVPDNFSPADGMMDELVDFLEKVRTSELIFPNQGLGDTQFKKLTSLLSGFSTVDVGDDQLKSIEGFTNHTQQLQRLRVTGNPIQNEGMRVIANEVAKPESVLEEIDAVNVGMNEEGLATLSHALSGAHVRQLVLGEDDFSQADFGQFGKATAEGRVEALIVRQAGMTDEQAVNFVGQSKEGALSLVDFSDNNIGNEGAMGLVVASQGGSLQSVNLNGNQAIDDTGAMGMAESLSKTNITQMGLGGTQISAVGVQTLIAVDNVKELDLSDSPIGDDVAALFSTTASGVEELNLANTGLTSVGARNLAQALNKNLADVTVLNLSDNNLPDEAVAEVVDALRNSPITELNLKGNVVGSNATAALVRVLPQIPIGHLNLRNTQLSDENGATIARALIEPTPHSEQIGNSDIDLDEIRAVREAKQTTPLTTLDISNNPTGRVTRIAFRQVLPSTNITVFLSNSTGVSRSTSDFFASRQRALRSRDSSRFRGLAFSGGQSLPNVNPSQPLLLGSSNSMQSGHVALGALAAGPVILIFLLLVYLLYRLLRKNGEDSSCQTPSRTPTRQ